MGLYRLFFRKRYRCPVCGRHIFEEMDAYEICPVCGWEDDPSQRRDPDLAGGANKMSLNEAIASFREKEKGDE